MEFSPLQIVFGGAISLASTLSVIFVQDALLVRRLIAERRQHPFRVVYDKQIAFFDELAPLLDEVNGYITRVDVWLGEASPNAPREVEKAAEANQSVGKPYDLLQRYYMYLPRDLLEEANGLAGECMLLSGAPTMEKTHSSTERLFAVQNSIRAFVGVDRLSKDFLKAFGRRPKGQGEPGKDRCE